MDFNTLVDAIASKVLAQVELTERAEKSFISSAAKANCQKLLVLTQNHGICCHEILESKRLAEKFAAECALEKNYNCDINDYDVLVVFNLNNEALSKISAGICDNAYVSLAVQAILAGKKIYIVREDVELFDYKNTAPTPYYNMMLQKIKLLEDSGVMFCSASSIVDTILGHAAKYGNAPDCAIYEKEQTQLKKKVITEKDVTALHAKGITVLNVGVKSILTDLAKDYAHERGITIVRE